MKTLLVMVLIVAIPRLQPFCSMTSFLRKGNVTGTDKVYVWRNGLAIGVTKFHGEWPSFSKRTVDIEELLKVEEEAIREDAEEQARADAATFRLGLREQAGRPKKKGRKE